MGHVLAETAAFVTHVSIVDQKDRIFFVEPSKLYSSAGQ